MVDGGFTAHSVRSVVQAALCPLPSDGHVHCWGLWRFVREKPLGAGGGGDGRVTPARRRVRALDRFLSVR